MAKRKRRRGNGEGGINYNEKRDKWIINYTVGRDPKTGKLRRKTKSFDKKEDAELALRKALYERDFGLFKEESEITLGDWMTYFIEDVRSNKLADSTLDNYRGNVRNHIIPAIGHIKLKELRHHHLQKFYKMLYEKGRVDGQGGLNPHTVQRIHVIIGTALRHAVRTGIITMNIAPDVERKKGEKFKTNPYTVDELYEMLQVTKDDRLYAAYVVSAMTGLRRGEVLGLRWFDIDMDAKYLKVEKSLGQYRLKKGDKKLALRLKPPKTPKSNRTVPIDDFVIAVLRDHKRKQQEYAMSVGREGFNPEQMVFCDEEGHYVNPNTYSGDFRATLKAHGLRHVRLHDLRHYVECFIMLSESL